MDRRKINIFFLGYTEWFRAESVKVWNDSFHIKLTIPLVRPLSEQDLQGRVLGFFLVITFTWSIISYSGKAFTRRRWMRFQALKPHGVNFTFNRSGTNRVHKVFKAKRDLLNRQKVGSVFSEVRKILIIVLMQCWLTTDSKSTFFKKPRIKTSENAFSLIQSPQHQLLHCCWTKRGFELA